jgi:hypothetical protein
VSARKIALLFLILGVGGALETAWSVRNHVDLGPEGCRVLGGRFYGPSWSFANDTSAALPPGTRVEVTNAFGAVRVVQGAPGEVKTALRKVVFMPTEEQARAFASRVSLRAELQGEVLRVSTNRDEVGRNDRVGLETHLDLEVPPGTAVVVRNEHGRVLVQDVAEANVTGSYDDVELTRVAGGARVQSRHGAVTVSAVEGDLSVNARHGDLEVTDVKGRVNLEHQHGQVTVTRVGALKLEHEHGDVHLSGIAGDLEVKAEHAGIEARDVKGDLKVETTYDDLHVANVGGSARLKSQHGEIKASAVAGALTAETSHQHVEIEDVGGPVSVTVDHGGARASGFSKGGRFEVTGDDLNLDGYEGALEVVAERASVHLQPRGPITERISVRTTQGGIRLEVPAGSRFDLDAETRRGEMRAELPELAVERSDARHLNGKLAGGGSPVSLTADGDVELWPRTANARDER